METETIENVAESAKYTIDSDTFTPTGEKRGNGCWGNIDVYLDQGENPWAIKLFCPNETAKKQMKERGWTEEQVMRNESIPLEAVHHHVLPRIIERDRKGKMFVAMPLCDRENLHDLIRHLNQSESLKITRNIADALGYMHRQKEKNDTNLWGEHKEKAHGDPKPKNVVFIGGEAYLTDLGSSTCISVFSGTGNKRGPHGDINYRAPECFEPDAKPSQRADVFSLGSMLYEAIAKQGIYDETDLINSNGKFSSEREKTKKIISGKIKKNIPRKFRKFLGKCLAVEPWERFPNGNEVLHSLDKVIEKVDSRKMILNHIKKWTLPITLSTGIISTAVYNYSTYEPKKLEMPNTQRVYGMLNPPNFKDDGINFEIEEIPNLPKAGDLGWVGGGSTKMAKLSTDNRIIAYLAKTHAQATNARGLIRGAYTDAQFATYMAYTTANEKEVATRSGLGPVWPIWAKSIEVALTQSKKDGKVDLEDTMTICRLGVEKVDEAKRISGSVDYRNYRDAKDSQGNFIIPKKEQNFIETWISYYKADID